MDIQTLLKVMVRESCMVTLRLFIALCHLNRKGLNTCVEIIACSRDGCGLWWRIVLDVDAEFCHPIGTVSAHDLVKLTTTTYCN